MAFTQVPLIPLAVIKTRVPFTTPSPLPLVALSLSSALGGDGRSQKRKASHICRTPPLVTTNAWRSCRNS
jgi:hypothetical protein